MTTTDPPCPDLDALEQALAVLGSPLSAKDRAGWPAPAVLSGGIVILDSLGTNMLSREVVADRIVAAVNALPGLIAEVRRLRAILDDLAEQQRMLDIGWSGDRYLAAMQAAVSAYRALASSARTDEAT